MLEGIWFIRTETLRHLIPFRGAENSRERPKEHSCSGTQWKAGVRLYGSSQKPVCCLDCWVQASGISAGILLKKETWLKIVGQRKKDILPFVLAHSFTSHLAQTPQRGRPQLILNLHELWRRLARRCRGLSWFCQEPSLSNLNWKCQWFDLNTTNWDLKTLRYKLYKVMSDLWLGRKYWGTGAQNLCLALPQPIIHVWTGVHSIHSLVRRSESHDDAVVSGETIWSTSSGSHPWG